MLQLDDRKIYDIQATKSLQPIGDQAAFDSMLAACQKLNGTIDPSVPVNQTRVAHAHTKRERAHMAACECAAAETLKTPLSHRVCSMRPVGVLGGILSYMYAAVGSADTDTTCAPMNRSLSLRQALYFSSSTSSASQAAGFRASVRPLPPAALQLQLRAGQTRHPPGPTLEGICS